MTVCTLDFPIDRMQHFQDKVGLRAEDFELLRAYGPAFAAHAPAFGEYFYEYFHAIPETRTVLDQEPLSRGLARTLGAWFADFFLKEMNGTFLNNLWRSGLRHVQINLDQRFVNLGYAVARQYCHEIAQRELPAADCLPVMRAIDKMMDFCVLVATDSFVSCSSRCDQQVVAGIAHQVRNPIMVIGGNLMRLQRQVEKDSPTYKTYEILLEENRRLERTVRDSGAYADLFRSDPRPETVELGEILDGVLTRLQSLPIGKSVPVNVDLDRTCTKLMVDPRDLAAILFYLLENSLEAVDPGNPMVSISSKPGPLPSSVHVHIFNTGRPPEGESLVDLFGPFKTDIPLGTGLGLAIARLATHRNMGWLILEPIPDQGARYTIQLPKAKQE